MQERRSSSAQDLDRAELAWREAEIRREAVLAIDGEHARIRGPRTPGQRIVSLGIHLLAESLTVRELPR